MVVFSGGGCCELYRCAEDDDRGGASEGNRDFRVTWGGRGGERLGAIVAVESERFLSIDRPGGTTLFVGDEGEVDEAGETGELGELGESTVLLRKGDPANMDPPLIRLLLLRLSLLSRVGSGGSTPSRSSLTPYSLRM